MNLNDYLINISLSQNNINKNIDDNILMEISRIKNSLNKETVYEGFCQKCTSEGNLIIDFNGISCLMLKDDVSITLNGEPLNKAFCYNFVGQKLHFMVKEINDDNIFITRKVLIENIRKNYKNIRIGDIFDAEVTNLDETCGVFVKIPGDFTGLIPKNQLSCTFIPNISDLFNIGDKLKVSLISLQKSPNDDIELLTFSRKSLLPSFVELTNNLNKNDIVIGKVKGLSQSGIYCNLKDDLDILCDFQEKIKINDIVRIKISRVSQEKKRLNGVIISKI